MSETTPEADLGARLDGLANAATTLATEVRNFDQRGKVERIARLVINGLLTIGIMALVAALVTLVLFTNDAKKAASAAEATGALVVSCTDSGEPPFGVHGHGRPPGKCYAKSQAQSAPVLAGLTDPRARADAAWCANKFPDDIRAAEACAVYHVSKLPPIAPPNPTPSPSP